MLSSRLPTKLAIDMVGTIDRSERKKAGQKVPILAAAEAHGILFSMLKDRIKVREPAYMS